MAAGPGPLPDLVAVGHVTVDRMAGRRQPGGSAWYAALAARRLGLRAAVLTSWGPDYPADALPADLLTASVAAPGTTSFAHHVEAGGRRLRLLARAGDLGRDDLPPAWSRAPLVLLCPVCQEVDPALAEAFPEASLGLAAQGWLRRWEADGLVSPAPWEPGLLLRRAQVLVVSRQDIAGQEGAAVDWFQQVPVGAVTLGRQGAVLYVNGERYHVAPAAAREVDPTGAGDVFAAVLLVEYHRTGDPWEAAAAAACAAAAAVEGPGAAALPDRAALEERLAAYRRRRGG